MCSRSRKPRLPRPSRTTIMRCRPSSIRCPSSDGGLRLGVLWAFAGLSCLVSRRPADGAVESAAPEVSTSTPFSGDKFAWPSGKRAAVSLTYDDALTSQLDHALPALAGHHL